MRFGRLVRSVAEQAGRGGWFSGRSEDWERSGGRGAGHLAGVASLLGARRLLGERDEDWLLDARRVGSEGHDGIGARSLVALGSLLGAGGGYLAAQKLVGRRDADGLLGKRRGTAASAARHAARMLPSVSTSGKRSTLGTLALAGVIAGAAGIALRRRRARRTGESGGRAETRPPAGLPSDPAVGLMPIDALPDPTALVPAQSQQEVTTPGPPPPGQLLG